MELRPGPVRRPALQVVVPPLSLPPPPEQRQQQHAAPLPVTKAGGAAAALVVAAGQRRHRRGRCHHVARLARDAFGQDDRPRPQGEPDRQRKAGIPSQAGGSREGSSPDLGGPENELGSEADLEDIEDMDETWGDFRPGGASYMVGREGEMEGFEEEDDDDGVLVGEGGWEDPNVDEMDEDAWEAMSMQESSASRRPGGAALGGSDVMADDDWPDEWPQEGDVEEDWDDDDDEEEDFNLSSFRFEETSPGLPSKGARKGDIFDGMDEPEGPEEDEEPQDVSARELSLLYDDFEVTSRSQTLRPPSEQVPQREGLMKERQPKKEIKRTGRSLDTLEEREYVVAAEGIAVRTLPDERSPRTGEIMRQGEKFTAIESVDGVGTDQRLYLRLPEGRGWVFDDEKIYPGLPSVKLVSVGGLRIVEDKPESVRRPLVAVIGRPNVGKTTMVNRIADVHDIRGGITWDEPGVTRDRAYKSAEHTDDYGDTYMFEVVDTGGLIFYDDERTVTFKKEIRMQIDVALREAVAAIMVVDSQTGLVEEDMQIARYLKKTYVSRGLKVVVAVAKCDRLESMDLHTAEFWEMDLGEPLPTSSVHGRGLWEVVDKIVDRGSDGLFPMRLRGQDPPPAIRDGSVSVSIVGLPNAGKSSLLNALIGEARSIVSDIPGTTTDAIDAYLETEEGKIYRFIDTAGIRRTGRIQPGTEWLSVNRAVKAVKRSDVALFCLDASSIMTGARSKGFQYWCPTNQQRYIARQIQEKGVACVIVLTKWDAVPNRDEKTLGKFTEAIRSNLTGVGQWAEVVSCSAIRGQRLRKILEAVDTTLEAHTKRIETPILNEVVRDALLWRLPAAKARNQKQGRIYYATQVSSAPPTIALFCNNPKLFGPNYKTYIENKLRQDLAWFGTPLQLEWRKRSERRAVSTAEQWLTPRLAPEEVWR